MAQSAGGGLHPPRTGSAQRKKNYEKGRGNGLTPWYAGRHERRLKKGNTQKPAGDSDRYIQHKKRQKNRRHHRVLDINNKTMQIKHDPQADALYIQLKKGEVAKTKQEGTCLVDYDKKGNLLGVEILNCSGQECSVRYSPPFEVPGRSTLSSENPKSEKIMSRK